ncbi:MAG: C40 family peptidase [Treponema sp.]|nr:C40 family peptidase [Treponema sp.]
MQKNISKKLHLFMLFCTILILCIGFLHAVPIDVVFPSDSSAPVTPDERAAASEIARSLLLAAAARYEHTPYRYAGITQDGLDCSGLVYLSFLNALGVSVPRSSEGLYTWTVRITLEEAEPGDLLFFRTTGTNRITHVGIYTGNRRFIHSASQGAVTGVLYSSLDERYWLNAYAGAGRVFPATTVP